jgi:hypothetical protein
MAMKLASATGGITFVSVRAPPADHKMKEKKKFYDELTNEINVTEGIYYIGGDFNARFYEVMEHEKGVIGKHIVERKGYINCQQKGKGINANTKEDRNLLKKNSEKTWSNCKQHYNRKK